MDILTRKENGRVKLFILAYMIKTGEPCLMKDVCHEIKKKYNIRERRGITKHFKELRKDGLIVYDKIGNKYNLPPNWRKADYIEKIIKKVKIAQKDVFIEFKNSIKPVYGFQYFIFQTKRMEAYYSSFSPKKIRVRNAIVSTRKLLEAFNSHSECFAVMKYIESINGDSSDHREKLQNISMEIDEHIESLEELLDMDIPKYEKIYMKRVIDFVNSGRGK